MAKEEYIYTGQETLEALLEAVNYSRYQRDFIIDNVRRIKKKNVKILDFGAGIGTYADMLKDAGLQVDCVEPDSAQSKILKKKGYKVYLDIKDVKTKYDVVYSLNVFEHIEDDAKALTDLKHCLSDKGVILVYVPAFMLLFTQLDVQVEHFRRYKIKDLQVLADKTKLNLRSVKYCDPIGFVAALTYRVIGGSGKLHPRSVRFFDRFLFPISVFVEPVFRKILGKNALGIYTKQ